MFYRFVVVDGWPRQSADLADIFVDGVVGEGAFGAGPHHVHLDYKFKFFIFNFKISIMFTEKSSYFNV